MNTTAVTRLPRRTCKSRVEKNFAAALEKLKPAGQAAYWGYKAFQAMRAVAGDMTVVLELGAEILAKGVTSMTRTEFSQDVVMSIVDFRRDYRNAQDTCNHFAKFSKALAKLLKSKNRHEDYVVMEQVRFRAWG